MPRYKPAAEKIAEHWHLKAKAQAIVSQMTTAQLRRFLMGRRSVANDSHFTNTQPQPEGTGEL